MDSSDQPWWPQPRGKTRVIVPIVAQSPTAAIDQARDIVESGVDLVEWRVDYLDSQFLEPEGVINLAKEIRQVVSSMPLIFTWRTADEGGVAEPLWDEQYEACLMTIIDSGAVDLVDIQTHHPAAKQLIEAAQSRQLPIIGSWHDTSGTPPLSAMVAELEIAEAIGADVAKLAVTAVVEADAQSLLAATAARAEEAKVPLVTVAMGEAGQASRIYGHLYGSSATFASLGQASAPGQPSLAELRANW